MEMGEVQGSGLARGTGRPLIADERGAGSMGSMGVVRRIIIWKRRESLKYTLFAKDEKPVNLLNLQSPLTL